MSDQPRTAFVIPARNAARTLAQTLNSVLAQGDADWQVLIVDDGSSDETAALAGAYAQRDRRFIALRGSGAAGAAAARNVGLHQARGRCVVFLDSDDWVAPTFLERMHAALDAAPDAAAAYCDRQRAMPDGTLAPVESHPQLAQAPFDTFARTCAVAIHAVLVERRRVLDAGAFDPTLRTCEDWDLWQRIARAGGRWAHVAEPLAVYRTSANSVSQDMQQLLADATAVIHRGFAADPRLPCAGSPHAAGASRAEGASPELALAYLALWCGAVDAARGRLHRRAHELLAALPPDAEYAQPAANALLEGVVVGLLATPQHLAARWADFGPPITELIDALGARWQDRTAARRLQYAFERLVLKHDDLAAPRALSRTLGLRVDLRALAPVIPPEGVDRFYAYLCHGTHVFNIAELGALGTFGPPRWIELAAGRLGWPGLLKTAAPSVLHLLTPRRIADGARSARGALRRSALRERGWRGVVKAAAESALAAATASGRNADGHGQALHALREQAAAQATANTCAPAASAPAHRIGATTPSVVEGRRDYWNDFFRTPDPWNYGSAYEQEKYGRQLELLPDRPIANALELACAEGRFTERLAARVQHLVASDISDTALARAAARCRGRAHIEFRQLDLAADALPQDLDLIVCSEVLYFLDDEAELRRVGERIAAALKPGGCLVTAHALTLRDDMTRTGFDWGRSWGASTISRAFAALPGMTLERSLCTDLYRIDRFVRCDGDARETAAHIETRPIEAEVEHEVARHIVWGGASTRRSDLADVERHRKVPVLAYHRIADHGPAALARYRVGAEAFGAQLAWLRQNGYHAIVSNELAWHFDRQHAFAGRPVMITFDDGYQDFADAAWPLLRRHDMRAEVFVVTDLAGRSAEWDRRFGEPAPLMDAPTIARLAAQGAHFGSHLASHRGADGLSTRELAEELLRSHGALAQWTGLPPCALAAPFGLADQRLQSLAAECGYRVGFNTKSAAASLADPPMDLPRIEVRGDMALAEFVSVLEACR